MRGPLADPVGARRDEEKSRAKERVYSFRDGKGQWDPKNQRPELWNVYNGRHNPGESIRVFPLSNWTELDVWQYIRLENIPIVPLYLAAERPCVERDGVLIMGLLAKAWSMWSRSCCHDHQHIECTQTSSWLYYLGRNREYHYGDPGQFELLRKTAWHSPY